MEPGIDLNIKISSGSRMQRLGYYVIAAVGLSATLLGGAIAVFGPDISDIATGIYNSINHATQTPSLGPDCRGYVTRLCLDYLLNH